MISRVNNYSGRFLFVKLIFILGLVFLIARLFYIQIYQDDFINVKIDSRIIYKDFLPAKRGQILDRNGRVLALDVTGYSLEIDLDLFTPNSDQIVSLAEILDLKERNISIILISHRMMDVFEVCDRIIVLRRGIKVSDKKLKQTSPEEVTGLITGAIESSF